MRRQQRIMVPEAFKVLPPLSPELPPPPRAPQPHRVTAPMAAPVPRRERTAFVILNDERPPPSRGVSPSGRVSPFRGRGFKEESSIRYTRDPSPSPEEGRKSQPRSRSRSKLPVATPRVQNGRSTPSSPIRGGNSPSGIPTPASRRNSLSPNRANKVLNQVNRNNTFVSPNHQSRASIKAAGQSPRHEMKVINSPKRVGPVNTKSNNSKPPLPKSNQTAQKENEKKNLTSPYKKRAQPNKPDAALSPSSVTRNRSTSRGRVANVRSSSPPNTSPIKAVVRQSRRIPLKTSNAANIDKKGGTAVANIERKNALNGEKKNGAIAEKKGNGVNVKISPPPVENAKPSLELDVLNKIPTPVEAVVSTVSRADEKTPELEQRDLVQETPIEATHSLPQQVLSPPPAKQHKEDTKPSEERKPEETTREVEEEVLKVEDMPEPTITLVRTTTAPALELAQPDVIPTILAKGEQEISKSISEDAMVEDKCENPGDVQASAESVRSTTSVETVRATARGEDVLSADKLMKAEGNGRTIAWDNKSHEGSPMNNSVHPLEPTPSPPAKKQGCCGRLGSSGCCGNLGNRMGAACSKLVCCKKSKPPGHPQPWPTPKPQGQQGSRLRQMAGRLNCFRWCRRRPRPREEVERVEEGEETKGCCKGCGLRCQKMFRAMFCLNLGCCQKLRACCRCTRLECCRSGGCCGPTPPPQLDRRKSRMSVRKSQTSISQGLPKLDPTLVEHQVPMMRGAVPVLPLPLAWLCCILNVFLPGTGTLFSGIFCLCFGKPRFSVNDSYPSRLGAFCVNIVVAISQLFTVLFCLVGWGWSIWWGVMMVKLARKQKRILLAEKSAEQPAPVAVNQNHDVERA